MRRRAATRWSPAAWTATFPTEQITLPVEGKKTTESGGHAQPPPAEPEASPPAAAPQGTALGFCAAGAPLEINLRGAQAGVPLVVVARCRGAMVGQQRLVTRGEPRQGAAQAVKIPLDEPIGGVLRLLAYDYGTSPPRLVAERLVDRRPSRWLSVGIVDPVKVHAPGNKVRLSLSVSDEKGNPVPAVLGVTVVEDAETVVPASSRSAAATSPAAPLSMADYFLLAGDVEDPGAVAAAAADHAGRKEAAAALDLVLGSKGSARGAPLALPVPNADRRVPVALPVPGAGGPRSGQVGPVGWPGTAAAGVRQPGRSPHKYEASLREYRTKRTWVLNTMILLSFFGGLGLALLVTMLAVLKIVWGSRLWLPTALATVCCLVVGAVSMDPSRFKSVDAGAVAFTPRLAPPRPRRPRSRRLAGPARLHGWHRRAVCYSVTAGGRASRPAGTLAWYPLLQAGPDGRAAVAFDLPRAAGVHRVTVKAHADGRLGSGQSGSSPCGDSGAVKRKSRSSHKPTVSSANSLSM